LALGALFCAAACAIGAGESQPAAKPLPVEGLLSGDFRVQEETEKALLAWRAETIRRLIEIVDDPRIRFNKPDSVRRAIRLLGDMRAVEAAQVLVRNIDFGQVGRKDPDSDIVVDPISGPAVSGVPMQHRYVAVRALLNIGEPVVPEVVDQAARRPVDLHACALVLCSLKGKETAIHMVEQAIEAQSDPKNKTRLEAFLAKVQAVDEPHPSRGRESTKR